MDLVKSCIKTIFAPLNSNAFTTTLWIDCAAKGFFVVSPKMSNPTLLCGEIKFIISTNSVTDFLLLQKPTGEIGIVSFDDDL